MSKTVITLPHEDTKKLDRERQLTVLLGLVKDNPKVLNNLLESYNLIVSKEHAKEQWDNLRDSALVEVLRKYGKID